MRKIIIIITIVLQHEYILGQAFKMESKEQSIGTQFEETRIDSTYSLYVKSICKRKSGKVDVPCNCKELGVIDPKDMVENEFLFLSKEHKKVVVINYIKDRDQKFYNKSATAKKSLVKGNEMVDVNIWFFNQARFGNLDTSKGEIIFQETTSPKGKHLWKISFNEDSLQIHSVSTVLADGFDQRDTELSLALVPVFFSAERYRIIFQRPYYGTDPPSPVFELPENRISVDTKGWCVYFMFNEPVEDGNSVIRFKSNRLYSYYAK